MKVSISMDNRDFNEYADGFYITAGITDISIDNSYICGDGNQGGTTAGILVNASGAVRVRNSVIGAKCAGFTSGTNYTYGVFFAGANVGSMVIGNDFTSGVGANTNTTPTTPSVVANNIP